MLDVKVWSLNGLLFVSFSLFDWHNWPFNYGVCNCCKLLLNYFSGETVFCLLFLNVFFLDNDFHYVQLKNFKVSTWQLFLYLAYKLSYIFLQTSPGRGGAYLYDIHFWLGKDTSQVVIIFNYFDHLKSPLAFGCRGVDSCSVVWVYNRMKLEQLQLKLSN